MILRDHTKNYSTVIYKNADVDGSDDDGNGYDNDDAEEDSDDNAGIAVCVLT